MARPLSKAAVAKELVLIGGRIRMIRKAEGYTTSDPARMIGLSQAQVSRFENGLQGVRSLVLLQIAAALKVSPLVFFMDEDTACQLAKALPRNRIRGLALACRN